MTAAAVEKPGRKTSRCRSERAHLLALGLGENPARDCLVADGNRIESLTVVGDLDEDLPALVRRPQAKHTGG